MFLRNRPSSSSAASPQVPAVKNGGDGGREYEPSEAFQCSMVARPPDMFTIDSGILELHRPCQCLHRSEPLSICYVHRSSGDHANSCVRGLKLCEGRKRTTHSSYGSNQNIRHVSIDAARHQCQLRTRGRPRAGVKPYVEPVAPRLHQ